jgi:hypothetical protein
MVSSLASKVHKTLHHIQTDETMVRFRLCTRITKFTSVSHLQLPIFQTETNGSSRKQKFIMGRRNWCQVDWDLGSGDLTFDIRVEKEKGMGQTVGCVRPSLYTHVSFADHLIVIPFAYHHQPGHGGPELHGYHCIVILLEIYTRAR